MTGRPSNLRCFEGQGGNAKQHTSCYRLDGKKDIISDGYQKGERGDLAQDSGRFNLLARPTPR